MLFSAAGGDKTGLLSYVAFSDFWRKMCLTHYDEAAQLMHILTFKNQRRNLLAPEDFVPLVQDVVDTHPGLGFLKEATEFHSRYVHTVSFLLSKRHFYNPIQCKGCWSPTPLPYFCLTTIQFKVFLMSERRYLRILKIFLLKKSNFNLTGHNLMKKF